MLKCDGDSRWNDGNSRKRQTAELLGQLEKTGSLFRMPGGGPRMLPCIRPQSGP